MIDKTHNKNSCIELLTVDERGITNPKEIAEQYNRYFAEIEKNILIKLDKGIN